MVSSHILFVCSHPHLCGPKAGIEEKNDRGAIVIIRSRQTSHRMWTLRGQSVLGCIHETEAVIALPALVCGAAPG